MKKEIIAKELIKIAKELVAKENVANKPGEYENFTGTIDWKGNKGQVKNATFSLKVNGEIYWEKGTWENGTCKDVQWWGGTWENGTWKYGNFYSGEWKNGTWKKGRWYGGTWKNGTWEDGTFCYGEWKNGIWKNGEWHGGKWYNGTWKNGRWRWTSAGPDTVLSYWYDGTWENGEWRGGDWYNGIWKNGTWYTGRWYSGTWKGGTWENGRDKDGTQHYCNPNEWDEQKRDEQKISVKYNVYVTQQIDQVDDRPNKKNLGTMKPQQALKQFESYLDLFVDGPFYPNRSEIEKAKQNLKKGKKFRIELEGYIDLNKVIGVVGKGLERNAIFKFEFK